jgi:RNA polymerase sigma-70 factor (ECF subfamily)
VLSADQAALNQVAAGQVRDALAQLSCAQREVHELAYYGGHTQREIVALTGEAVETMKSRLFTGIGRMRTLLGPLLAEPADGPGAGGRDSRGPR